MHYLSFKIAHQWYGIPVDDVIEVLQLVYLTEMPGVKAEILGLMTLREKVVPVVDMRVHFRLPPVELSLSTPIVAIRTIKGPLGLIVDEVDDVREIMVDTCSQNHESPYIRQVINLGDRFLMLLNTEFLYNELHLTQAVQ